MAPEHDYGFEKDNAIRILRDGDKVKATINFRGREITHKELGFSLLQRLEQGLHRSRNCRGKAQA